MLSLQEIYAPDTKLDKGGDKGTIHSYIDYYAEVFIPYRDTECTILEIGVEEGHSMRMWRKYFSKAQIVGVDTMYMDPILSPGCTLIQGDATVAETFAKVSNIDVVIDDGSHSIGHQLRSFNILWPKLNAGGIYIIEDVRDLDKDMSKFLELDINVKIHDFRKNKNRFDDVIIEIRK